MHDAVFLLIGIPSVRRISGNSYLLHTLQSVVSSMTSSERSEVKVVVFLADLDPAYNQRTADVILKQFGDDVNSGLMTILRVLPDYYPRLEGLHRNFGDSVRPTFFSVHRHNHHVREPNFSHT